MSDRTRTCGARIRVTQDLYRKLIATRRDASGPARHSVTCELAAHPGNELHRGVGRVLSRIQPTAVWLAWSDDAREPVCFGSEDCGRADLDGDGTVCTLFSAHPGVCSGRLDTAAEDPARPRRIISALDVLDTCTAHNRDTLVDAAHDAVLLTWDELRARRVWSALPACDQAAVHRLVSRIDTVRSEQPDIIAGLARETAAMASLWAGPPARLPGGVEAEALLATLEALPAPWQAVVLGGQRRPREPHTSLWGGRTNPPAPRPLLAEALQSAAAQAEAGMPPPPAQVGWEAEWDRKQDRELGAEQSQALTRLPYGWRVDALRRVAAGLSILAAVGDAAVGINMLCSYGVSLAWNAPRPPAPARSPR
ncbi:hypothetical protein SMD44_p10122 (plasmid) [Streptomyces alboflavus]|uniref:Uncharacterized protein n=1 Tax=Streptomyces alboflavus TaxID=67267 RepID=A0A291W4Q2_9ACTN|nr:hypothetical protein [Streptomyces alboflavus]ATM24621.1 hypothetical protein SMD44_p10122 [Streptomyces alboflavus]